MSADTIVPDAGSVLAYNRYLYAVGNPLKYSDPSGHFSEEQLIGWYGEDWRDKFSEDWQTLLLNAPGHEILGAQLGDLIVHGSADALQNSIIVLGLDGMPALWDIASKSATSLTDVGATSPDKLALYRIVGGESGQPAERFSDSPRFLPGLNGRGGGPYEMAQLSQYSPLNADLDSMASVPGDWFMGRQGGEGYVMNHRVFDSFSGGSNLLAGAAEIFGIAELFYTGGITLFGGGLASLGAAIFAYQVSLFRDEYYVEPCQVVGVAWCQ